jgi:membrane-bound metal-dependent hydrolase YbcI (DUF457 family)
MHNVRKHDRKPDMSGGPHTAAGIAAGVSGAYVTGMERVDAAVFVIAAVIASLLPDADCTNAKIFKPTHLERKIGLVRLVGWILRLPLRPLVFLPHRGPTHWLSTAVVLASLIAAAVVYALPNAWAVPVTAGFLCGYVSHLILDMMTPSGLKVLGPFKQRRYWVLPRGMRFYVFKQRGRA